MGTGSAGAAGGAASAGATARGLRSRIAGRSTNRHDSSATATVPSSTSGSSATYVRPGCGLWLNSTYSSPITARCHRYTPYVRRPIHLTGRLCIQRHGRPIRRSRRISPPIAIAAPAATMPSLIGRLSWSRGYAIRISMPASETAVASAPSRRVPRAG